MAVVAAAAAATATAAAATAAAAAVNDIKGPLCELWNSFHARCSGLHLPVDAADEVN